MADILIRGMEMPKTCQICRTAKFDRIIGCEELDRLSIAQRMYMRSETCPLVPLPEGHGRLIDIKDVESKKFHIEGHSEMYSAYNTGWNDALDAVCMNVHPIVPAEGGYQNEL